ncbi:uncharacterized protein M6B38_410250 [Iris pallida]|uniref:Transmembrane protein n=1 Tax=Iris pallida TaxID=29817 RepID=A0AAX6FM97_IRIPA|nr:uncharacterized protein M6B38_410250 [Iris pallida]
MGISNSPSHTHKFFLLTNYILLGAATSCIFLTLSLRLIPSVIGFLVILLHLFTILSSVFASSRPPSSSSQGSAKWHVAHMAATVLAAIVHGAVALLVLTRTAEFLWFLQSYVRVEDGVLIMRMVGVLGVVIFCLEWVVLVLAFVMRFYVYVEGGNTAKVQLGEEEVAKDWPWPFQV